MNQSTIIDITQSSIYSFILLAGLTVNAAEDSTKAKELFEQMNSRFASLTSLSYTVNRTTITGIKSIEEKWDFRLKAPSLMKIEYYTPNHRLVVINETVLWEYIPSMKKALRTDLAAMPEEKKVKTVSSLMSHVAVDGLRIGDYSKMIQRVTSVTRGENNIYIIQGQNPKFVVHTDGEKNSLIHSELYDEKGDLMIQTDASQFVRVAPEFWFPQNITAIYRSKNGMIKSQTVMTNIRANDNPADEIFLFTPPEGVKVSKN